MIAFNNRWAAMEAGEVKQSDATPVSTKPPFTSSIAQSATSLPKPISWVTTIIVVAKFSGSGMIMPKKTHYLACEHLT